MRRRAASSEFGLVDTPYRQREIDIAVQSESEDGRSECFVRAGGSSDSCCCVFEQTVGQVCHAA